MNTDVLLPKCNVVINLIVGTDLKGGIGYKNKVLFNCPNDTQFYKDKTQDTIVIMGRGTFESLNNKVLADRLNIVVSSKLSAQDYPQYCNDQLLIFSDFVSVIDYLNQELPVREVFVIGGESVYQWFMENDYVDYIYLNIIDKIATNADRFFSPNLYIEKYKEVYNIKHQWDVDNTPTLVSELKLSRIKTID